MSSRSSSSVSFRRLQHIRHREPRPLLRRLDQHPGKGDQAREALRPDRRLAAAVGAAAGGRWRAAGRSTVSADSKPSVTVAQQADAPVRPPCAAPSAPAPRRCRASEGSRRSARARRRSRSRRSAPCRAPCRPCGLDGTRRSRRSRAGPARRSARGGRSSRVPSQLPELPVGAAGVVAAVEVLGGREVVLGLRRVADLALDPREAEDADRIALVGMADQIELAVAEDEVVGVRPCASRCRRAPSCSR